MFVSLSILYTVCIYVCLFLFELLWLEVIARLCFLGFSFNVTGISFNLNSEKRACIVFDNVGDTKKEIFFIFNILVLNLDCVITYNCKLCVHKYGYLCLNMYVICGFRVIRKWGQLLNTKHNSN